MVSLLLPDLGHQRTLSVHLRITGDTPIKIKAKGKSRGVVLNLWVVTPSGTGVA